MGSEEMEITARFLLQSWDEMGAASQEQKERCGSAFSLAALRGSWGSGGACWGWGLVIATSGIREAGKGWCVGSTGDVDRGEGRLQLVFCFSARDKIAGTESEEKVYG